MRSLYNVGAFFRTLEAAGGAHLYLAGISATPPHAKLAKTALGADETVPWTRVGDVPALIRQLQAQQVTVAAVETTASAVDVFDWRPRFPVCVVFGHEVDGLSPAVIEACDVRVRIPMLGRKSSLNVATAGGIVIYELLRQYRDLHTQAIVSVAETRRWQIYPRLQRDPTQMQRRNRGPGAQSAESA